MELIGIVRAPVALLKPYGTLDQRREHTKENILCLRNLFETAGCEPSRENNLIDVIVASNEVPSILSKLGLGRTELIATITASPPYPLLRRHRLAVLHGRRRIEARRDTPGAWWAVRLFCVEGIWESFPEKIAFASSDAPRLLQQRAEHFSHESTYSDGKIYSSILQAQQSHDEDREARLWARLSVPKKISLRGLLKHEINSRFKQLLRFPGLIEGLQLGNVHKIIALHCDEQVIHYIEHIYSSWMWMTAGSDEIARATDFVTVKSLQFRTPSRSQYDREEIRALMGDGTLWKQVTDPKMRASLLVRTMGFKYVIPTVLTLHENMKYLAIGVKILNKLLKEKAKNSSLFESLKGGWTPPDWSHNKLPKDVRCISTITPLSAYAVLVLAALRNFTYLQAEPPRKDKKGELLSTSVSVRHQQYLVQLAYLCGFRNSKITSSEDEILLPSDTDSYNKYTEWRGGRPYTSDYLELQQTGYLHRLVHIPNEITPTAIIADFMHAFFGDIRFLLDDSLRERTAVYEELLETSQETMLQPYEHALQPQEQALQPHEQAPQPQEQVPQEEADAEMGETVQEASQEEGSDFVHRAPRRRGGVWAYRVGKPNQTMPQRYDTRMKPREVPIRPIRRMQISRKLYTQSPMTIDATTGASQYEDTVAGGLQSEGQTFAQTRPETSDFESDDFKSSTAYSFQGFTMARLPKPRHLVRSPI